MIFIEESLRALPHNPHYLNRYFRLIEKWNGDGGVKHHILPKKLFPEFRSLPRNTWNNARLTHRQHFIIHWVLWKALPESAEMRCAFWAMTNKDGQRLDSKTYEVLRKLHGDWNRETKTNNPAMSQAMSENRKNGVIPTWNKGVKGYKLKSTPEGLAARIKAGKKKPSEATKKIMGKSMSSLPRVCCVRCQLELAGHHLNRHLNGNKCI